KTAWQTLNLSGRMNFDATVIDFGVADQPDLDVLVRAGGCAMRPKFFDFELTDVGGTVHYTRERVTFDDVQARHGPAVLRARSGQVLGRPDGGYQTRIGVPERPGTGLVLTGMNADAELLAALPPHLREGLSAAKLHGPFDLSAVLVVDPQEAGHTDLWWDGTMTVQPAPLA